MGVKAAMAFRIPKSCRYSFSIDLKAGTVLAVAAAMVAISGVVLRKSLNAPAWVIIVAQSIQTGSMLLAPAWAGAAIGRRKAALISGGAIVSGILLLITALTVPTTNHFFPGLKQLRFFGATPDILLFAVMLIMVYFSIAGFLALMAAVYRQNYPATLRAQILSRANVWKLIAGQSVLIAANFTLDRKQDVFVYWLIMGAIFYIMGGLIYSRMHVLGEMTLPRGINWDGMKSRLMPGKVYALLRRNPHFRRFQFCQTLHGGGNLLCGPAYLLVMTDVLKLSYLEIGLLCWCVPAAGNIISTLRWAPLVDRLSPCRARVRNSPLWIAGLVLFPLSVYFNNTLFAWVSYTCTGLAMGGSGLLWSLGPLYYCNKEDAAEFSAVHSFLTGVRGFIFIVLGGQVYLLVGTPVFFLGAAMMTMAMYLFHRQDLAERSDPAFMNRRKPPAAVAGPSEAQTLPT